MSMTPPPPPGYTNYSGGGYGTAAQPHPRGTTILVLGIVSIVLCGLLTGIPAIIMGTSALKEIDANPGAYTNRGSVNAGRICGIIGTALSAILIIARLAAS